MDNNGNLEYGSSLKPCNDKINMTDINPYLRYVAQENFAPLTRCVRAYDHRLFYVLKGGCKLNISGQDNYLYPDSLAIIRPGDAYTFHMSGDFEIIDINFDYTSENNHIENGIHPSFAEEYNESRRFGKPKICDGGKLDTSFVVHNIKLIRNELIRITEEFELKKVFYREKSSAILKDVLCDIARYGTGNRKVGDKRLDEILSFIRSNFNKELSNEMIAAKIGYHPYYVNRLVKSYTGTTLRQYIINCRIDAAKKLLRETDKGIEDIGTECGFKNMTHFSDSFKIKAGVSPVTYRKGFKKVF